MKALIILLFLITPAFSQDRVFYNETSGWSWPDDLRHHMRLHGYKHTWTNSANRQQLQIWHDRTHDLTQQGLPNINDAARINQRYPKTKNTQVRRNSVRYYSGWYYRKARRRTIQDNRVRCSTPYCPPQRSGGL